MIKEVINARESILLLSRDSNTDSICNECELPLMDDTQDFDDMGLYLHAWKYYQIDPVNSKDKYGGFEINMSSWATANQ